MKLVDTGVFGRAATGRTMNVVSIVLLYVILLIAASPLEAADVRPAFVRASDSSFSRPHDLVLSPDQRHLYVADVGNDVVKVLDPYTLVTLGAIGAGQLSSPHDVAFTRDGRLLVADTGNDRIAIYSVRGTEGRLVAELQGGLGSPEGVAEGPEGRIYVTNASLDDIVVFTDGKVSSRAGSRGDGENMYVRPHDVDIGANGAVYVVDPGNNRVQILNQHLGFVTSLQGAGYNFNEPKYLAVGEDGSLYIADEDNHQVRILDRAHRPSGVIGTGTRGRGRNQLNGPEGVTVWRNLIWISDTYNSRILLYRR